MFRTIRKGNCTRSTENKRIKGEKAYEHEKGIEEVLGGAISVALSVAMVIGIFAGMGMEVRAEERWCVKEYNLQNVTSWDEVKNDFLIVMDEDLNEVYNWLEGYLAEHQQQAVLFIFGNGGKIAFCRYIAERGWMDVSSYINTDKGIMSIAHWITYYNYESYILQKESVPSTTGGDINNTSDTSHTHSYAWITVQEVNSEQDGIEEYRCSCGDVQGRSVIPASAAVVSGLYGAIKDAPQNGTATFDTGSAFTMTDYVIRKLAERTDVTTVITFTYQNQSYRMTIPAGVDYTELLSDEDYFYGYFYFANAVGATIEAL